MPRRQRITPGGFVYHVMNRAAGRLILFENDIDYMAFESLMAQAQRHHPIRIIVYCLMRNHWHLLLWPDSDGAIRNFIHKLCTEHGRRWRRSHDSIGRGAVYQGRYRTSAIQNSRHLFTVWRYIERNPLRAGLVERADAWPWSSLSASVVRHRPQLTESPISKPENWVQLVNQPQTVGELRAVRDALREGAPFGESHWMKRMTGQLDGVAAVGRRKRGRTPFNCKGVRPLFLQQHLFVAGHDLTDVARGLAFVLQDPHSQLGLGGSTSHDQADPHVERAVHLARRLPRPRAEETKTAAGLSSCSSQRGHSRHQAECARGSRGIPPPVMCAIPFTRPRASSGRMHFK